MLNEALTGRDVPCARFSLLARSVVVFGFLGLQVGVATWQLMAPRPSRFGWQMFSALPDVPTIEFHLASGKVHRASAELYVGTLRPELNFERFLPVQVCAQSPGVERVVLVYARSGRKTEHACR